METLRTFVAIDVNIETELDSKWKELKILLQNDTIKWVDEKSLHLTLFFLGETSVDIVEQISFKLETELQKVTPFKIFLQGFGTFGKNNVPKVIWAGISKSEQLIGLKNLVAGIISGYGFEEQHGIFSPHFTLGRVKQMRKNTEFENFIRRYELTEFQETIVDKVIFYQSVLTPKGPIYRPLKIIKLLSL